MKTLFKLVVAVLCLTSLTSCMLLKPILSIPGSALRTVTRAI